MREIFRALYRSDIQTVTDPIRHGRQRKVLLLDRLHINGIQTTSVPIRRGKLGQAQRFRRLGTFG